MNRLAAALALLLSLAFAAPALGSDLQSTDTLDQRLDQGSVTVAVATGDDQRSHAASQRSAVCTAATVVHNSNPAKPWEVDGAMRLEDFMGKYIKGNTEVPGEFLDMTVDDAIKDKRIRKIVTQERWYKPGKFNLPC